MREKRPVVETDFETDSRAVVWQRSGSFERVSRF